MAKRSRQTPFTPRQRKVLGNVRGAMAQSATPTEARHWKKAFTKAVVTSPGTVTAGEKRLIKSASKAVRANSSAGEAKGVRKVLRRAAKGGTKAKRRKK